MSSVEALAEQVEELLQFVYLMPVAIIKMGSQGEIQMVNPIAVQLLEDLDLEAGTQDGANILEALCAGLTETWSHSAHLVGEVCAPIQVTHLVGLQEKHLLLKLVRPDPRCTMLAIEDVTEIVEKEREISRQRQRFGVLMEQIEGYCVIMLDPQGCMLEWNPSIGRMFGDQTKAREMLSFDDLLNSVDSPEMVAVRFDHLKAIIEQQGAYRSEAAYRHHSGQVLRGDLVATPTVEVSGRISGYVCVIRDITEQYSARVQLLTDAMTDPLTGLLNRRGLEHRVTLWQASESGSVAPASWIMADIDHFKKVNDTYGHDVGDEVLKAFANVLMSAAREGDIIARLGGEEFLVLLPGASQTAAMSAAERMRACIEKTTMAAEGHTFYLTSSFGVVTQASGADWHAAVSAADAALYEAKAAGRNRVVAS